MRKTHRGHYQKKFIPYPFTKDETIDVQIESLSAMGHGVARTDHTPAEGDQVKNWVIFVPYALPEETVKIRITHNSKKNSIGEIVEIIKASADRVQPNCEHFQLCGGCQLQHLNYSKQLSYLAEQLQHQLSKTTSIEQPVNAPVPSPMIWNYRSKITPQHRKNKKGKIEALGFSHHSDKNQLIDIKQCAIAATPLNEALPEIRKQTFQEDILLRLNQQKVETHPNNVVAETVGDLTFHFLAGDFFQNNTSILPQLTSYVCAEAKQGDIEFLVDAYCGCGLFALTCAKQFKAVTGVEISASSADWARFNAEHNIITNAEFHTSSSEEIFSHITYPADQTAVIVDPPRAGCSSEFLDQLFAFNPRRVVYVSCDPATQIRDLSAFTEANYKVTSIQPFDLFPHTRHLECVISLDRA